MSKSTKRFVAKTVQPTQPIKGTYKTGVLKSRTVSAVQPKKK